MRGLGLLGTALYAWLAAMVLHADAADYSLSGPFSVGEQEVMIEDVTGLHPFKSLVWYPAIGPETNPTATQAPPLVDAAPATDGPFPLIVVIHGFPGAGLRYRHLGLLLASHGFVVMAPSFDAAVNRQPDPGVSNDDKVQLVMMYTRPANVVRTIAYADALTAIGGKLEGVIDTRKVGIFGHSAGGVTGLQAGGARIDFQELVDWCTANKAERWLESCDMMGHEAAIARAYGVADPFGAPLPPIWDKRVAALVLAAPGGDLQVFGDTGVAAVKVPTLFMVGLPDQYVNPDINAYWAYHAIGSKDKSLAVFDEGGHMMFVNPAPPQSDQAASLATAFFLRALKGDKAAAAALSPDAVGIPGLTFETTVQ